MSLLDQRRDAAQLERMLELVRDERAYQDKKYGAPGARGLSVGDYLVILRGELAEAEQAFCKGVRLDECLDEVLQVAAVAVACMQQHEVERETVWLMRGREPVWSVSDVSMSERIRRWRQRTQTAGVDSGGQNGC